MSPEALERYLHEHIPLSRAMGLSVVAANVEAVTLQAPLAPNINHRDTVFGGSAAAMAVLAAWSLLHLRLVAAGLPSRLVIQHSAMDYLMPIAGTFRAEARPGDADWERFTAMLTRKGRARITQEATLTFEGQVAGRMNGEFVAFANERL